MLVVRVPSSFAPERSYIVDTLLREFLGLEYELVIEARDSVEISSAEASDDRRLVMRDALFATPANDWLSARALPDVPISSWKAPPRGENVPVLFGEPRHHVDGRQIRFDADIFGGAFFMLTRFEELVVSERDAHDRFPATASIARRAGFLDRPIVNQYLEALKWALAELWPSVAFRPRDYRLHLSHDVDSPWLVTGDYGARSVILSLGADLLRRRDPRMAARRAASFVAAKLGNRDLDLFNTFEFLMTASEQVNTTSAFYFMTGVTDASIDGGYDPGDPWISRLRRTIHDRGHEIGLHPSYRTYLNPTQTAREFERLRELCAAEGIEQRRWGGRQHYLRWRNPDTWRNWAAAKLDYDSTLGFADEPGFRCGVCYEFPVFDLEARETLALRERPLVAMDATLFSYQGLSREGATEAVIELSEQCRRHGGELSLLVHNSKLSSVHDRRWYRELLERIS